MTLKYILLCFFLVIYMPLTTTQAEFTGDIVYIHPDNATLWRTSTWDGRNAHHIFTHSQGIEYMAVQKNGPYILIVAMTTGPKLGLDAYLVDRTRPHAKARNLTWQRYDSIQGIDISRNGDVVFLSLPSGRKHNRPFGIYLIPREVLENKFPEAKLLRASESISSVRWAPDSMHIVYTLINGDVYIYNAISGGPSKGVTKDGHFPVFSPEGDRLAFAHRFRGMNAAISVISVEPLNRARRLATVAPIDHVSSSHFIWAPDGQSIIYNVNGFDRQFHSYRAPLDGGPHEEIFEHLEESPYDFDWTEVSYAVEPTQKLTTLWGALKVDNPHSR